MLMFVFELGMFMLNYCQVVLYVLLVFQFYDHDCCHGYSHDCLLVIAINLYVVSLLIVSLSFLNAWFRKRQTCVLVIDSSSAMD